MYILKLVSVVSLIYSILGSTIERNKYPVTLKNYYLEDNKTTSNFNKKIENKKRSIFRKKISFDLKYHTRIKISNNESTVRLILNNEGKIIGYKPCNVFYPNYFTKTQQKQLIKIGKKFKLQKINPCIIKYKITHARIDF